MQKFLGTLALSATGALVALAAPPNTPSVTSPLSNGVVNATDVHMETGAFFDSDGDSHSNSDWLILSGTSTSWFELAASGTDKLHTHLGQGSTNQLAYDTDYVLMVRHRDNTGAVSAYAQQPFHTASLSTILPLLLQDATSASYTAILPPGGSMRVESTN